MGFNKRELELLTAATTPIPYVPFAPGLEREELREILTAAAAAKLGVREDGDGVAFCTQDGDVPAATVASFTAKLSPALRTKLGKLKPAAEPKEVDR